MCFASLLHMLYCFCNKAEIVGDICFAVLKRTAYHFSGIDPRLHFRTINNTLKTLDFSGGGCVLWDCFLIHFNTFCKNCFELSALAVVFFLLKSVESKQGESLFALAAKHILYKLRLTGTVAVKRRCIFHVSHTIIIHYVTIYCKQ